MSIKKPNSQNGFAMMEALITALIVAIGISGVGVLLLRSIQATQDSSQQSQAMWIVQDFAGRLKANSPAAKNGTYIGTTNLENCGTQPTICASYNINGDITDVTDNCTSDAMAAYDTWISVCGLDSDNFDTPSDFIANPELNNVCLIRESDSNDCVRYSITLSWHTKLKKGSDNADDRTNTNDFTMIVEVN
jgi:type IV pilus modification protein PilV